MKSTLLAALALACATSVLAQTAPPPAPKQKGGVGRFERLDLDHDGFISRQEAQADPHLARHFDAIDTDHDGRLSHQEMKSYRIARKSRSRAPTAEPSMAPPPDPTAVPETR